ncbi:hypothetical protein FOZ62_031349, partial [Perkinsus olseni]
MLVTCNLVISVLFYLLSSLCIAEEASLLSEAAELNTQSTYGNCENATTPLTFSYRNRYLVGKEYTDNLSTNFDGSGRVLVNELSSASQTVTTKSTTTSGTTTTTKSTTTSGTTTTTKSTTTSGTTTTTKSTTTSGTTTTTKSTTTSGTTTTTKSTTTSGTTTTTKSTTT